MATRIGVDIGGTSVKAGRLHADGSIEPMEPMPTLLGRDPGDFLDRLARRIEELGAKQSVGIGVPGIFAPGTRTLAGNPNLKALTGIDLRTELGRRLGWDPSSIQLENDANVAALGEARLGAGREVGDLVMVTLGTGIGGGIVMDGKIVRGSLGRGAEIGHLVIHDRGPESVACGCGRYGCLESYASATATIRRASEQGLTTDLGGLADCARAGEGPERALLEAIGADLGRGLALVLVLLDLPTI
ncbi:MAG TPA: ROK family protein, partial [Planctomycetota bacterium]|nr:ROK family protein [Planctomycetota bacterium]